MDKEQIVQRVMNELEKKMPGNCQVPSSLDNMKCGMTEYVGVANGNTIGLVIANVDESIHECLGIEKKYKSLGIVGARSGAGPQAMAADEAVKATNTELVMMEMPRDTEGHGGHGIFMVFGAEEVSDARRAVEITLKALEWTFGGINMSPVGYCEMQYTARASYALAKYFNAPLGKAWGLVAACPAAIGMVAADAAVKSANVDVVMHGTPALNTSHSNEFMIMISGDSGAVKQAVIAARETAIKLISQMGEYPQPLATPYF